MAVHTIGTTARTYTTVTLFHAAFGGFGAAEAIGECYADSDFDESFDISDNTVTNWILRPAAGEGHTGVQNTGVRFLSSAARTIVFSTSTTTGECNGLEFDNNGNGTSSVYVDLSGNVNVKVIFRNNIVHGNSVASTSTMVRSNRNGSVTGNIVYDSASTGATTGNSILIDITSGFTNLCAYNTCFDSKSTSSNASSDANGIQMLDDADHTCKNNISMDTDSTNGSNIDFKFPGSTNITSENNISEDTSSDDGGGSNHKISQSTSGVFVSTTGGSEDFHIIAGSTAISAGLAVSGDSAEIDINGYDRTSLSSASFVADCGSHQFLIKSEIGTAGRDFTTFILHEAGMSSTSGSANSKSQGDVYDDSVFNESPVYNDSTPDNILITVPVSERHSGIAGTGARIVGNAAKISGTTTSDLIIEWIELDSNGAGAVNSLAAASTSVPQYTFRNMIIHGNEGGSSAKGIDVGSNHRKMDIMNCIIYSMMGNNGGGVAGAGITLSTVGTYNVLNNTVYDIRNETGGSLRDATGIVESGLATATVKNNISMGIVAANGTANAFTFTDTDSDSDYNMSDDATADDGGGANNLINEDNTLQFVSTTDGSEDLHLMDTSGAIGAGVSLGTTDEVNIDINGYDRSSLSAGSFVTDMGGHQALIKSEIGTTGRDFTSITLWEAALGTTAGSADSLSQGDVYDDSVFDESVTINDATPASIKLTVPVAERHDGTAGTGARIDRTANADVIIITSSTCTIEWLEIKNTGGSTRGISPDNSAGANVTTINNCIIHGMPLAIEKGGSTAITIINNILYAAPDINDTFDRHMIASTAGFFATSYISNNTLHSGTNTGTGTQFGLELDKFDDADVNIQNNIITDFDTDFEDTSYANATADHNISSDATASGTGSLTSVTSASLFVSTTIGSEDLHILDTAVAIGAGVDLGTTPTGVNIDIDGTTRGAIWDIGAHESSLDSPLGGGGSVQGGASTQRQRGWISFGAQR